MGGMEAPCFRKMKSQDSGGAYFNFIPRHVVSTVQYWTARRFDGKYPEVAAAGAERYAFQLDLERHLPDVEFDLVEFCTTASERVYSAGLPGFLYQLVAEFGRFGQSCWRPNYSDPAG
jgi:hypothetical protein